MSVPIDRHTGVGQTVYALIFNGVTRASSTAADEADWIRLSERERIAEAVYAELQAGNIEFRLGGLAMLARVAAGETAADTGDRSGYVHPLVHVNRSVQDPAIPPCHDCGGQVDDYYTEPNRCGGCNAKHLQSMATNAYLGGGR